MNKTIMKTETDVCKGGEQQHSEIFEQPMTDPPSHSQDFSEGIGPDGLLSSTTQQIQKLTCADSPAEEILVVLSRANKEQASIARRNEA